MYAFYSHARFQGAKQRVILAAALLSADGILPAWGTIRCTSRIAASHLVARDRPADGSHGDDFN